MTRILLSITALLALAAPAAAQTAFPGAAVTDPYPQPAGWVAVEATLEINGAAAGRYWRSADGSTRLEYTTPDTRGITIEIRNVTERRYYVFRPSAGWTVQPMALPTQGWLPPRVARQAVGQKVAEVPYEVHERTRPNGAADRHVPALNFLKVRETTPDGSVRTLSNVKVQEPAAGLMRPPNGAPLTTLSVPGGIVALPSPRR